MKKMKLLFTLLLITILSGCGKAQEVNLSENIKKIELTGNLVTYQAYYHNVLEYEKNPGSGIQHLFEKKRTLFAEYTGTIKYGINLSKVQIEVNGNNINVFIPKATIIGEPNVDKDDFKTENFIESKDGVINKNPLTVNDSNDAFNKAQQEIKSNAIKDEELLSLAQKRAKVIIEENIDQFSGLSKSEYTINWEYEQ